jgi:hypothetical protein
MSDNLQNRGQQDRARINLHEKHEIQYWTKALGVKRPATAPKPFASTCVPSTDLPWRVQPGGRRARLPGCAGLRTARAFARAPAGRLSLARTSRVAGALRPGLRPPRFPDYMKT